MIEIKVHVVGHVEVEVAVVVVVAKGRAGAPASGVSYARFRGHIGERSVVVVVVKHPAIEISDVEVFPAVIVVIADGDAEAPAAMRDSGLRADVGESSVMIVVVELAGMALARAYIVERGTVDQEDVHPAVVVVIKDRHAAAHGFHDVELFRASTGEVEIDAGGAGDVGKGNAV